MVNAADLNDRDADVLYLPPEPDSYPTADSGGWDTMDVELFPGAREWLAHYLRGDNEIPLHPQRPRVDTRTAGLELPHSAELHVNTANCIGTNDRAFRGRLCLPLRMVPVIVTVWTEFPYRIILESFLRKAHAKPTLMHPRIWAPVGFRASSDHLVLVLPALRGGDLRTYLRNHPNPDKRRLIIQIAEGLEFIHNRAADSYGSLDPAGVHITDSGDIVLNRPTVPPGIDEGFNLLSRYEFINDDETNEDRRSMQYKAPEILVATYAKGPRKTRENDMYSFGMLVYEILSGREPWADARLVDIFRYIVSGHRIPRPEDGTIDDSMWSLCNACWSQDPADRPGIANVLAGLRSESPPVRWRPDAAVKADRWLRFERSPLEGYAIPSALDVEINGSIVNIVLQNQAILAGALSTVIKGYSYRWRGVTAYAVKICRGKSVMQREYEIWKSLRHENILQLLGIVDANLSGARELIFVSYYIENGHLTRFLELVPEADRLSLMIGVAKGLAYLHDIKEIVHGDIKPENILITDKHVAVLADFGFSTYVAPGPEETLLEMRQVYTLTYCAPEILDDTAEDQSHPGVIRSKTRMSDMYAFGVLLYQTYAGGLGRSQRDRLRLMLDMHDGHFPPRPVGHDPILCDDLWSICKRCWARDPLQRPTIATVLAELEALHSSPERQMIETVES